MQMSAEKKNIQLSKLQDIFMQDKTNIQIQTLIVSRW